MGLRGVLFGALAAAVVAALALGGCASNSSRASGTAGDTSEAPASAVSSDAISLQIFAANSLTKAMAEAEELYTSIYPDVTFADTQYKGSGELNAMLEGGAYADIEITASKAVMDTAAEEGFIDEGTRVTMFTNELVMVTSENNAAITEVTLEDIATGEYTVGVGDDSVPAGNYANQALATVGCFKDPEGATGSDSAGKANGTDAYSGTPLEGKVNTQTSVGNVCKLAESGEVQIAFVYSSDVERFGGVKVVGVVPADTHKPITYPGAVTSMSNYKEQAEQFINWCLTDKDVLEIWQKWGFALAA